MKEKVYLTTTLPYINADMHIGFALEIVQADIWARYQALMDKEVFFNTGTDEHGAKVYQRAIEENKDPQTYVDGCVAKFKTLKEKLNLWPAINFIRTTDQAHKVAAQEFWRRCMTAGDIEKKLYKTKYCVGCELGKTDSELENDKCPIHPNLAIEIIAEENYFFKFSKYQDKLLALYDSKPDFVLPTYRLNEIKSLIKTKGLEDFSISRLASKMPWGVPVPNDPEQVMYVWFDALVSYISALGWPDNEDNFKTWWPVTQFAGKDQVRQQVAMWQAMLMSAGLPPSKQIIIHGFVNVAGQKMSKSLGNVIDPYVIVAEYGTDALRYYLARHIHPFEDSDFTMEKFKDIYNAHLANGLGNLTSRIMTMAEKYLTGSPIIPEKTIPAEFFTLLEQFEFNRACDLIWERVGHLDTKITRTEPFKLIKIDKDRAITLIQELVVDLYTIGRMLNPIMPETSTNIKKLVKSNQKPIQPIFARKD